MANDTGFVDIPPSERALMKAVATVGPISAAMDASHPTMQFYKDGNCQDHCHPDFGDLIMLGGSVYECTWES